MYEISVIARDGSGNPIIDPETGQEKRRYFKSENASDVETFWNQNTYRSKSKKRKSRAATKSEVKGALNSIEEHVQKREKRKAKKANPDDSAD